MSVPDDFDGITYCSVPKKWVGPRVVLLFGVLEKHLLLNVFNNRRRHLQVEKGHNGTTQLNVALNMISTEMRSFAPNATHFSPLGDKFVIQEVKRAWATH